jgi:hypothetical protein
MLLWVLLFFLLLLALAGGGWGYRRYGYLGWSPLLVVIVVLLLFWFMGLLARPIV